MTVFQALFIGSTGIIRVRVRGLVKIHLTHELIFPPVTIAIDLLNECRPVLKIHYAGISAH